jgi:adenylosuccinate synthase
MDHREKAISTTGKGIGEGQHSQILEEKKIRVEEIVEHVSFPKLIYTIGTIQRNRFKFKKDKENL